MAERRDHWTIGLLTVALLGTVSAYVVLPHILNSTQASQSTLQREEILWRQRVLLLQRHAGTPDGMPASPRTLDGLRITLQEALDRLAGHADIDVTDVRMESSHFDPATEPLAAHFETMRLILSLEVPHAQVLLRLLGVLRDSVDTWPAEWRGCAVQRLPARAGLKAECTLDIYHDDVAPVGSV